MTYEFKGHIGVVKPSPQDYFDSQTNLINAETEIKRLRAIEQNQDRIIKGMEESRAAGLRQVNRLRDMNLELRKENNDLAEHVNEGDALLRKCTEELESLMPVINDAILPPQNYPSEEARVIFTEILPTWWESFLVKNTQYSKVQQDSLGCKGVFPDIHRKTGALRRLVWDEEEVGAGEDPRTIINDLIGHLFLMWFLLGPAEAIDVSILADIPPEFLEYLLTQAEAEMAIKVGALQPDPTPADAEMRDDEPEIPYNQD
jgi:hypothetical protein